MKNILMINYFNEIDCVYYLYSYLKLYLRSQILIYLFSELLGIQIYSYVCLINYWTLEYIQILFGQIMGLQNYSDIFWIQFQDICSSLWWISIGKGLLLTELPRLVVVQFEHQFVDVGLV